MRERPRTVSANDEAVHIREESSMTYSSLGNNLRITVAANQGGRRYMEDRVHLETVRFPDGSINYTYVAVYDGHGGAEASQYTKQNLLRNIQKQVEFDSDDDDTFLEAIRKGFLKTHYAMKLVVDNWPMTASGYPSTAGTTASVAFIRRGKVFTGHVGDSSIVLGRRVRKSDSDGVVRCAMNALRLTVDHKPESVEEETRIRSAGGEVVCKSGVMRVVWERPVRSSLLSGRRGATPTERIPFLAVARSLGDLWSWNPDTERFIVSPEPDLDVHVLDKNDVCIVLASDGLTNVLAPLLSTIVVDMCEQFTAEISDKHSDNRLERPVFKNHARLLLKQALSYWRNLRADNISVISVILDSAACELGEEQRVDQLGDAASIDRVLTLHPDAMIRITPGGTERLHTEYTPIIYQGTLDNNADCLDFCGPGFFSHADELAREAEHADEDIEDAELDLEIEEKPIRVVRNTFVSILPPLGPPPAPPRTPPATAAASASNVGVTRTRIPVSFAPQATSPRVTRSAKRPLSDVSLSQSYTSREKYVCKEHGIICMEAKAYSAVRNQSASTVVSNCAMRKLAEEEVDSDEEGPPQPIAEKSEKPAEEMVTAEAVTPPREHPKGKNSPRVTRSAKKIVNATPPKRASPKGRSESCRVVKTPKRRIATRAAQAKVTCGEPRTTVVSSSAHSAPMVVTRRMARERTPDTGPIPDGFLTPSTRLVTSERRSSRKRPHVEPVLETGITPLVGLAQIRSPAIKSEDLMAKGGTQRRFRRVQQQMELQDEKDVLAVPSTPVHASKSEPSTPVKSPSFVSRLPPSRWSLGRLDGQAASGGEGVEPPAKRSKIWGFLRRLVGVGGSQ